MSRATRSLWPEGFRRPWLQLGFALVAAPVVLAGGVTVLAFSVYAASEPDTGLAAEYTARAAAAFLIHLLGFTLSLGVAGVALLWALGRRGAGAWLATGAGAGALFSAGVGVVSGGGVAGFQTGIAAVFGLALFALIRWFAGVRAG